MKQGDIVRISNPNKYYDFLEGYEGRIVNMSRDLIFVRVNYDGLKITEGFCKHEIEVVREEK